MAKFPVTVPVTVSFVEEDVLEKGAFYKKVTPKIVVNDVKTISTNMKAVLLAEVAAKKKRIKLGKV